MNGRTSSDPLHFLGTFDYAMDERGRVPLPPLYRDAFRAGMVLSQGSPDKSVRIFTPEAWEKEAERYLAQSTLQERGRNLQLVFFSRSYHAQLDPQHRVLIPANLRAHAGLGNRILLVGGGAHLQVWDPAEYQAMIDRIDATLVDTMESAAEDGAR